jgi:putative redox protein
MKTVTTWNSALGFTSEYDGHSIELNGANGPDGKRLAFGPKALLLSGLAGCSGIDVVEMLDKMRVPFGKLVITAEAEQTEEHPRVFKDIHISYNIETDPENLNKVKRAVELSLGKYCGVAAMLKKNCPIFPKVHLLPK